MNFGFVGGTAWPAGFGALVLILISAGKLCYASTSSSAVLNGVDLVAQTCIMLPQVIYSAYIPAVIFLCFIIVILFILLSAYQCVVRDMCPCTKIDKPDKPEGYEELGEEESEEEEDKLEEIDDEQLQELAKKSLLEPTEPGEEDGNQLPKSVSAYGDIQVDTGLKTDDNAVPVFGQVHFKLQFKPNVGRLSLIVVEAKEIPGKKRGGSSHCRIHILLLPGRKQRFKTKTKETPTAKFNETFLFDRLIVQDLYRSAVRMRLYGVETLGKEKLVGECVIQLADLAQSMGMKMDTWRDFRARLPGHES